MDASINAELFSELPRSLGRTSSRHDRSAFFLECPVEEWLPRIDPRYRPVWEGRSAVDQIALARYFLPVPVNLSAGRQLAPTRPRLIKWYDPFAHQGEFPSGHRYCINVYTGCAHDCRYCYAAAYAPAVAQPKRDFESKLERDLADLDRFNVPPAPVHISNSTDPFQPLEERFRHTRLVLERLLAYRHRFSSVTLLTKNPAGLAKPEYLELLRAFGRPPDRTQGNASVSPTVEVQVSLAFWREQARRFWDPGAPAVKARLQGIRALREAGVPMVLRLDPLFPWAGEAEGLWQQTGLEDGIRPQTREDLESLVAFAREVGVRHIVYSAVKIVPSRGRSLDPAMAKLRELFRSLCRSRRVPWAHGSWRLSDEVRERCVTGPFLEICRRHQIRACYCKQDLLAKR